MTSSSFGGGDWEVLDLDADPTPGDPDAISSVASGLLNEAQLAQERAQRLQSVADSSGDLAMQGDYAPQFQQVLSGLPGPPGDLADSYQRSAGALSGFADALAGAQGQSSAALERGTQADSMYRAALDEFCSVVPLEFSGTGTWRGLNEATATELAGPMADETENPELLDWAAEIGQYAGSAEDDRQAAVQMALDAAQQRSDAEQQCAQAIQDATPQGLPAGTPGDGGGSGGSGGSGGKGGEVGSGSGESWDSRADSPEVDAFISRAKAAEPEISRNMQDIKQNVPGSDLPGYDKFRLKTEDSLRRKISTDMLDNPNKSTDEVLSDIKDSVRYTLRMPADGYANDTNAAVDLLKAKGYENVSWKPSWESPGYKGINSAWRDPATGQVFEVQFHTADSFSAKMEAHPLYEQWRLPDTPQWLKDQLDQQQMEIFGRVPLPPGLSRIGRP